VSTANDAPSTAADGTADIPEQQDAISVDGISVGSLTKAILAMEDDTAEAMYECVMEWAMDVKGVELYEAQEEAIMELADGNSVLLTTPTGSGKTLVATAAIAAATARGDVRARSPRSPLVPPLGASDGGPPARRVDDRDLSARCSLFFFSFLTRGRVRDGRFSDGIPTLSLSRRLRGTPPPSKPSSRKSFSSSSRSSARRTWASSRATRP
jgi:hypothetical protein